MSKVDFSNVWAYAFSYAGRDFLYERKWDGRVVEGSGDIILVGRVDLSLESYNEIVEIKNSSILELDDLMLLKSINEDSGRDLIRESYEDCVLKDRKFKLEDVFGRVCLGGGVEEVRI